MNVVVRHAQERNFIRLTDIYNYHIKNGDSTFQTELAPSFNKFREILISAELPRVC